MHMTIKYNIRRIARYYHQKGIQALLKNIVVKLRRDIFQNNNLIYYIEIRNIQYHDLKEYTNFEIKSKNHIDEIDSDEFSLLKDYLGKSFIKNNYFLRYNEGATLWTIYESNCFVGYFWTIRGKSLKKQCLYHMGKNDVEIFDVVIFSKYRGKRIYSKSIEYLLKNFKEEFIEKMYTKIKTWNLSAIKAAESTRWEKVGIARQFNLFGKKIVIWFQKY